MNMIDAPRTKYNHAIAAEWYRQSGIVPGVPPIERQAEVVPIKTPSLHHRAYNPSLMALKASNGVLNGNYAMAYRHHPTGNSPCTALSIAEMDKDFNVTKNHNLRLDGQSQEDPRFFWHKSAIWMSWVEARLLGQVGESPTSVVKYGRLNMDGADWIIEDVKQPAIGSNDGTTMEKNWVFFEHRRALRVFHQTSPETVIFNLDGTVYKRFKCPRWGYGHMRGGTTPVPFLGNWLRFVHSALDTEQPPWRRRYYVGAILYDKDTLEPMSWTKEPLLRGPDYDDLTATARASCWHYKSKVVFPLGACETPGGYMLSVGINDSACAIVKLTSKGLGL